MRRVESMTPDREAMILMLTLCSHVLLRFQSRTRYSSSTSALSTPPSPSSSWPPRLRHSSAPPWRRRRRPTRLRLQRATGTAAAAATLSAGPCVCSRDPIQCCREFRGIDQRRGTLYAVLVMSVNLLLECPISSDFDKLESSSLGKSLNTTSSLVNSTI